MIALLIGALIGIGVAVAFLQIEHVANRADGVDAADDWDEYVDAALFVANPAADLRVVR